MYSIIQSVINAGSFELTDILRKIDILWLKGDIDDDRRTELIDAAREKADPPSSYAPLQEQLNKLAADVDALAARAREHLFLLHPRIVRRYKLWQ